MQANPEIEVSVSDPTYAWLRLHGTAVFENNMEVKEGAMNNPIVKGSMRRQTTRSSKCSTFRMHMASLQISPEIRPMNFSHITVLRFP